MCASHLSQKQRRERTTQKPKQHCLGQGDAGPTTPCAVACVPWHPRVEGGVPPIHPSSLCGCIPARLEAHACVLTVCWACVGEWKTTATGDTHTHSIFDKSTVGWPHTTSSLPHTSNSCTTYAQPPCFRTCESSAIF